jgi:Protein of unknown function (DUF2971)
MSEENVQISSEGAQELFYSFMPESLRRIERVRKHNIRFVHYTSGESAMKILRTNRMLLRNSTLLNDFSEVQHGLNCISYSWTGEQGKRLQDLMKTVQPDLPEIFEPDFNSLINDLKLETYITSISEHGDIDEGDQFEDSLGRLSMWRAYAPKNGVAFVFNNAPFVGDTNVVNAYTCPVIYADPESYAPYFKAMVDGVESNIETMKHYGGKFMYECMTLIFSMAMQSTKHPSFREEREWRLVYTPTILSRNGLLSDAQMDKIPTDVMCLGGVPQRVYAIPFQNYPDEGFVGATIPELLDRVLIGPSNDSWAISQAIVAELRRLNVENPDEKVFITGIPLRHF